MLFPRLLAVAELAWTMPERKVWEDFKFKRLGPGFVSNRDDGLFSAVQNHCWLLTVAGVLKKPAKIISHEGGIPIDQASLERNATKNMVAVDLC